MNTGEVSPYSISTSHATCAKSHSVKHPDHEAFQFSLDSIIEYTTPLLISLDEQACASILMCGYTCLFQN
jgi:hypothetical protein